MQKVRNLLLVAGILVGVGGCGPTYYRVTDPTTSRAYYTTELKNKDGGSVQLRDANSGRTVTLQNSEVQKVTREEYESGRIRSVVTPAPAPTSPTAPTSPGGPTTP